MDSDISTDPSDYSDLDDNCISSRDCLVDTMSNNSNNNNNDDDISTDEHSNNDDESTYYYSSEASCSNDDENDIKIKSLSNNINNTIKPKSTTTTKKKKKNKKVDWRKYYKHKRETFLNPIKCQHCSDTFNFHTLYRKHMNEIHKIDRPYICSKCSNDKNAKNKRYANKCGLDQHIERDHDGVRRFKCKLCPKQFHRKSVLEQHQRVHDKKKPYKCPYCELRLSQKNAQRRHIQNIHLKQKNYKCTYCGKRFAALGTMKSHVVSLHNDDKYVRFECTICQKRYYEKGHYYKHIENAHRPKLIDPKKEMIKRGECFYPQCNKKYTRKNPAESVKYHLVAVHNDVEYANHKCKKCKKLFYDKTAYKRHIKTKHEKHATKSKKSDY